MGIFSKRESAGRKPQVPVVLMILDGLGVAPPGAGNAVTQAKTPNLDKFWPAYPHTYLQAAGTNVGLPHSTDGNSEVGHINIGAGKVVFQDLPRIDNAIASGAFFKNEELLAAIDHVQKHKSTLHIMGLIGSGEVHSSLSHVLNLNKLIDQHKLPSERVLFHCFTDGRDSAPKSALDLLDQLEADIVRKKTGRIASIIGRYYAMDRDKRWDRIEKAYKLIANGEGTQTKSWQESLKAHYAQDKFDEVLEAYVIPDEAGNVHSVKEHDAIIFFNFRPDRAIELTHAFADAKFSGFERKQIADLYFVGMTDYEEGMPEHVAFPPENITNPLGKIVSDHNFKQLRIAESEKFPHVTYFLNGGNDLVYPGEERIEIPSPKDVATYDQKPEMSAAPVTEKLLDAITNGDYGFIAVNYANADMVAHTGVLKATIKAMEILDEVVGKVAEAVIAKGGVLIISADHGNAEELIDLRTGEIDTKHSINPVPLMMIGKDLGPREIPVGILADIAPTVLKLLAIDKPLDMSGRSLL